MSTITASVPTSGLKTAGEDGPHLRSASQSSFMVTKMNLYAEVETSADKPPILHLEDSQELSELHESHAMYRARAVELTPHDEFMAELFDD